MNGSYIYYFLSMITVFAVWKYLLIAVGLAAVAGIRTKLAAIGIFGLWILYVLAAARRTDRCYRLMAGAG